MGLIINGDVPFKGGGRGGGGEGRLDVTLVNSDASFRGWGKRLRTSMNIQEIYTWPRLFKRWIALSTG